MKLNNKDSTKEMSSIQRDKSIDIKEKAKQEKLQKEKEKKEKERLEKERKEREKRLEKEKKEREKLNKKGGGSTANVISAAATSSDLNKIDQSNNNQMSNSKSENMLSKLRKQTSLLSSSASNNNNQTKSKDKNNAKQVFQSQIDQQPLLPKGRFRCQVVYLDESVKTFDLDKNAIGDDLFTKVCEDLELVEKEYFSLTYRDYNNMKFWLDHEKKIKTQLKGIIDTNEPVFNFEVKFYPPEPKFLQEEITRYLLTLQLRHDIMDGKLPCTFVTHALLGSFTVQAELGDYDEINNGLNRSNGFTNFDYLEGFCFAPNQTTELLAAIADCHKDHKGQSPAEAEMHYLENAVKLAMYGVDLHNAKDSDGVDILIGVSASGLLVFRDHLRINRFAWPKILKISYKRNHFYLKLRPGEFEKYETTIGFRCPNHKAAKRLWKIAVEHHAFFRLREPEKPKSSRVLLPNFNEKFRYTGSSTYMQSRNRSIDRPNQPQFTRSLSKRLTQSMDRGLAVQNPNETPGSVQSAAFNHFNRMKQHQSTSNLPNRNNPNEFRESQEDLEIGGDYNVNDQDYLDEQEQYNNNNNKNQNRFQQQGPANANSYVNNPNRSPANNNVNNGTNFSNRSNSNDPYKTNTLPNFGNQIGNQNEQDSFDQLDEYYTSVDRNYPNDSNRNPSMNSNANSQKVSTPIMSQDSRQPPQQQQSSNRYVPSRPFNPQQQQQQQYDGDNQYPLPVSPRSNLPINSQESEPVPFIKTPIYPPGQDQRFPSNRTGSDRSTNLPPARPVPSSTSSSFRPAEQYSDRQQTSTPSNIPQPPIRGSNRQPPPVPADRTSLSSQSNSQRIGGNQPLQFLDQQELQQRELELQQEILRIQQQKQFQQQQSSYRQPGSSSATSFQNNQGRTIESSRSGSHTSTPDASRVKKQIVVNENVNHKDLLLKAIQMATELDPNLEVEKVEISTEE